MRSPQTPESSNVREHNLPPVEGSEVIKKSLQTVGHYVRDLLKPIIGRKVPRDMSDVMEHMYPGRGKDFEMEQSRNVGDCYFVAALYGLKHNEIFEHLVRKMVKKDGDNWIVQFPDGSAPITITPDDLSGQKTPDEKTGKMVRRKPVKGGVGDIILERAYGRFLKKKQEEESRKAQDSELTYMVLRGGYPAKVFEAFLNRYAGYQTIYNHRQWTIDDNRDDIKAVEIWLNAAALNPNHIILVASTPSNMPTPYSHETGDREFSENGEKMYFMDKGHFFYQGHAYTITAVNAEKRLVTIANPHDTKRLKKTVSYDNFMKIFNAIYAAKLEPRVVQEELSTELPLWKGPAQGFHFEHEPQIEVEFHRENVEEVLNALANANEFTLEMQVKFLELTPQELARIKQKYSAIVTTAKFGGRNVPSEVNFAKEVLGCIQGIEAMKRQKLDGEKSVYIEIKDRDAR